ncbi:MAG: hypothetical protein M1522_08740, partial [Actinobacteria bacterium]|nr:hypothetical protein [Actinomycetota bacterium]
MDKELTVSTTMLGGEPESPREAERRFRALVGALPVRSRIAQNDLVGAVRKLAPQAPLALVAERTWR